VRPPCAQPHHQDVIQRALDSSRSAAARAVPQPSWLTRLGDGSKLIPISPARNVSSGEADDRRCHILIGITSYADKFVT